MFCFFLSRSTRLKRCYDLLVSLNVVKYYRFPKVTLEGGSDPGTKRQYQYGKTKNKNPTKIIAPIRGSPDDSSSGAYWS